MNTKASTSEVVVFNGIRFRRYPESDRAALRNYFWPGISHTKRGVKSLHVEIWKSINGPVPEGHHVHHVDGNTLNNDPGNLEALTFAEHSQRHFAEPERLARAREHIEAIRPLSKAWHRTERGKAFHKEHGKVLWEDKKPQTMTCEECNKTFTTLVPYKTRFCSNNCRSRSRRKSGVDNVERSCVICGKTFAVNRHEQTATCSGSCAYRNRK